MLQVCVYMYRQRSVTTVYRGHRGLGSYDMQSLNSLKPKGVRNSVDRRVEMP